MAEKKTTKKSKTAKASSASSTKKTSSQSRSSATKDKSTAAKKTTTKKAATQKAATKKAVANKTTKATKSSPAKATTKKTAATKSSAAKTKAKDTKTTAKDTETKKKTSSTKKSTKTVTDTKAKNESVVKTSTKKAATQKTTATSSKTNKAAAEKPKETAKTAAKAKATTKATKATEKKPKKATTTKKTTAKAAKSTTEKPKKATTAKKAETKTTTKTKKTATKATEKKPKKATAGKSNKAAITKTTTQKAAAKKTTKANQTTSEPTQAQTEEEALPVALLKRVKVAEQTPPSGDPVEHFARLVSKEVSSESPAEELTLEHEDDAEEVNWEEALEAHKAPIERMPAKRPHNRDIRPPKPPRKPREERWNDEYDEDDDNGMVRVKIFHPDVVPGGGYIEREVPADQIPPGAILVNSSQSSIRQGPPRQQRPSTPQDYLPSGGILDAGRKLVAEGRLQYQETTSPTAPKPTATPKAQVAALPSTPKPTAPTANKQDSSPAGLGSGFLQGLPPGLRNKVSNDSAKQALHAAFGGAPSSPKVPQAPSQAPKAAPQAAKAPATNKGMILDGRLITTTNNQENEAPTLQRIRPIPSPHVALKVYELQIKPPNQSPVDAHIMLWEEAAFSVLGRVNDCDPRPRVLAEEGIRGLGMEARERDLQRWSIREWWEQLEQKEFTPYAAFAGSRVIRDSLQVAFVRDPQYDIYRLYQPAGLELSGEYPMLFWNQGMLSFAAVSLDGVNEKERFTPERMEEIFASSGVKLPFDLAFTALPSMMQQQPVPLYEEQYLAQFRDQLEHLFRFPQLELPDPLGGTGSIKLHLGLWEMSQESQASSSLRYAAAKGKAITLQASAGYLSDLVRRELWRMKGKPAQMWGGYTPKEVAESIRVALREDHYNMQGFQPKKPGDYTYDPETGAFHIVLKRKQSTHTMMLRGATKHGSPLLGALTIYNSNRESDGFNSLEEYSQCLQDPQWESLWDGLQWQDAWLTAPAKESRCAWADSTGLPIAPAVRNMPEWHRGVALGLFLVHEPEA